MKTKEHRFNELVSILLSDELSAEESAELIQSVEGDPEAIREICTQLEVSEMITLTLDTQREDELFLKSFREKIIKDSSVKAHYNRMGKIDIYIMEEHNNFRRKIYWSCDDEKIT